MNLDIDSLFYLVAHVAMGTVHSIDLIGRVYKMHQLVDRCAKKTTKQSKNVLLGISRYLFFLLGCYRIYLSW